MAGGTLILGGTGFIGRYVARLLLERGEEVCLFDVKPLSAEARFTLGGWADRVAVEVGSVDNWPVVLDVVKRYRPRRIVHAAMIIDPAFLTRNPTTNLQVNFLGTVHALEAARLFEVERLVYFSSIGVLPPIRYQPIDADHPIFVAQGGPTATFYGAAKIAGEAFCFAYVNAHGLDCRVVRPSAVYGFGMAWPIYIKPMVEGAVRGEPVRIDHGGSHPRDYTHAADVAGLVAAMLDGPADADRIFYGATGRELVTASQVARIVRELVPGADVEIAEQLGPGEEAEVALRGRLSIENARHQLDWQPRFADIRDGLADYVDQYRAFLANA
jgi:nucleoside-diphosphate-sugar epimerase